MSRLPRLSRLSFAACSAALLVSCASPSIVPAGYTYHRELYKSPPAPKAEDIGYEFSIPANEKAVAAWRDVARDLSGKLESGYIFQTRDIALVPPLEADQISNSLHYALHEAFAAKGYRLENYSPDYPGIAATITPLMGEEKAAHQKSLTAYAASHGFKPDDVTGVAIRLDVREGADLVHQARGIYSIPVFTYDPELIHPFEFRKRQAVGKNPFWTQPPELKPARIRPAAPYPLDGGADEPITSDDLPAPGLTNPAEKPSTAPVDLKGNKP